MIFRIIFFIILIILENIVIFFLIYNLIRILGTIFDVKKKIIYQSDNSSIIYLIAYQTIFFLCSEV